MAMFVKRARSCCCCYDGDADREDGSVSPLWLQSLVGEQKRDETKAARSHGLSVPPTNRWFQMVVKPPNSSSFPVKCRRFHWQ
ncbi:uncharacterized protein BO96DRAFT_469853 [Aspergillus niger CBS 101883]|uniref:uncharacterized protein n=1 Tax=Aspergillus lacticoffeatus (strain CBS 101883) TaxID=1450533 RepID=UPI000D7F0DF4|nr:uncharacterized protein BO96DRAFT_469853 [Aspergillus niger CBS 101883]PYH51669.1 hypothetical protein BO96DRAFT_469853 [Aspergillus niger CBS 101883]